MLTLITSLARYRAALDQLVLSVGVCRELGEAVQIVGEDTSVLLILIEPKRSQSRGWSTSIAEKRKVVHNSSGSGPENRLWRRTEAIGVP